MPGLKIPFDFAGKDLYVDNEKESIEEFITLLIHSANGSFKPDSRFGFSLKNFRFENVDSDNKLNKKRIEGKSESINNYALDLKEIIKKYEPRLLRPEVKLEFDAKNLDILMTISGTLASGKRFIHNASIHIW